MVVVVVSGCRVSGGGDEGVSGGCGSKLCRWLG